METNIRILIALSAVQALALIWLCTGYSPSSTAVANAADSQAVTLVEHRLSRYQPVPVAIQNDNVIRVRCVD